MFERWRGNLSPSAVYVRTCSTSGSCFGTASSTVSLLGEEFRMSHRGGELCAKTYTKHVERSCLFGTLVEVFNFQTEDQCGYCAISAEWHPGIAGPGSNNILEDWCKIYEVY